MNKQPNTSLSINRPPAPLADRMRPQTMEQFVGQSHLLGVEGPLRRLIERDWMPSMIFWGVPGVGKTTLVGIIARRTGARLESLSAVTSGVRDVRRVIEAAQVDRNLGQRTILFIDEIHRFNKAQQDALLHAVEDGTLTLIGATTENPSFEVIGPLLSRCRVFKFEPLTETEIEHIITQVQIQDPYIKEIGVNLEQAACEALVNYSGGDARTALNAFEIAVELALSGGAQKPLHIGTKQIEAALMTRQGRYDKKGDYHYDVISAFIKSLRGSDPDGAIYWLARMIDAGEDPLFIARRMVILASEDIGNANPNALVIAQTCAEAVQFIGMPESTIILAHAVSYLASSPKSNASYKAVMRALEDVKTDPDRPVPLHLRNAVTGLMKAHGYGKEYKYAHDFPNHVTKQQHLPDGLTDRVYYEPTDLGQEKKIAERLRTIWPDRYRNIESKINTEESKKEDNSL